MEALVDIPDSLCAQVLRAKYFVDGKILEAMETPNISYSWRSILRGIKALKEGLIWRVGTGENINIWLDPWIPNGVTRRPCTPRGRNIVTKVSKLIDSINGGWNHQLVNDIFWEEDAKHILAIPIRSDMDDFLAWHYDKKGVFSVKSAYHVLDDIDTRENRTQQGESSSGTGRHGCEWNAIWKLKCLPKVRQFLWRLAHNSLPSNEYQEKRDQRY